MDKSPRKGAVMLLKRLSILIAAALMLTSLAYAGGGNGKNLSNSESTETVCRDHHFPMGGGIGHSEGMHGHNLGAAGN